MGWNSVPVSMPEFSRCTSPLCVQCFHKTLKDFHGLFKKDRDTHSNLILLQSPKLYISRLFWASSSLSFNSFTSVSGTCDKSEKLVMTPVQKIEFPGMISTEQSTINKTDVSGSVSESTGNIFGVNKGVRSSDINKFGHFLVKLHCCFLQQQQIQTLKKINLAKVECYWKTNLKWSSFGGWKHWNIQWKDFNSTSTASSFTGRCFTHRLAGSLGRSED